MKVLGLPFGATVSVFENGDRDAFLAWLGKPRQYLAVDVETTGLGRGDTVRLVQFGDSHEAWVLQGQRDRDLVTHAVTDPTRRWVAWNAKFDVRHLSRLTGVPFEDLLARTSDTSVLAGVLDPRARYQGGVGHRLEEWAAHLFGDMSMSPDSDLDALFRERGWGSKRSKKCVGWVEVPLDHPVYLRYSGADPVLTARVHAALLAKVRPRADTVRREQTVSRIVARVSERGLRLDQEHTERLRLHYAATLADAVADLSEMGVTKIGSTKQIARRLEEEGLEQFIGETEKHNQSVDKAALKAARVGGSLVAPKIIEARRAKRFSRDFAEMYQAAAAIDGRVHPGLRSIGTKTRRMTASEPNLQQVPKEDVGSVPLLVRDCFAADEGGMIVRADYATMEFRYAAAITGDRRMIADVTGEGDLFVVMAEQVWPGRGAAMRQKAKIICYASMYGAGPRMLAQITGLPQVEAARMKRTFLDRYPVFKDRFYRAMDEVGLSGGVDLPMSGFLPTNAEKKYVGMNLKVQGGCRDLLADRLVAMDAAGMTPYLRMILHDECVWSVPADEVEDFRRRVEEIMPINGLAVPIPVDTSVGRAWGDAYKK